MTVNSTDRTVEVARAMRPDIVVVPEMGPGKGAAVRTGIAAATGEFIVMIDADGSMEPLEIPRYVEALSQGADLVKGSRFLPGGGTSDMTRLRMVGNRVLLGVVNTGFGTRFTELCYGFMAFRRDAMLATRPDVGRASRSRPRSSSARRYTAWRSARCRASSRRDGTGRRTSTRSATVRGSSGRSSRAAPRGRRLPRRWISPCMSPSFRLRHWRLGLQHWRPNLLPPRPPMRSTRSSR